MGIKNIKYRIVYNRKGKYRSDGTALLQIEIYDPNIIRRRFISTGIYLYPEQWDKKAQAVIRHSNAQEYNIRLQQMLADLRRFEFKKREEEGYFDLNMFDELELGRPRSPKFFDKFEEYLTNHNVSKSRKQYIKRTIAILREFRPTLTFVSFNLATINEFDTWLSNKHYHINTIAHFHKVIRAFLNEMKRQEVIFRNPYDNFKIKTEKTEKQFLTEAELKAIEKLELDQTNGLQLVRDMFLFSCYTGLRFSDVQNLKINNVEYVGEQVFLNFKQQKTKEQVRMPIHLLFNGKPVKIIAKYFKADNLYLFPRITNQATNRLLKVIALSAGIKKTLTFHVARHTFGTLLAMYTKDPYLIKKLMGHSDMETSMTYIHLSNKLIEDKLKKIEW